MTVIELHPDDLLDKEADGDLTAEERVRLEAHLARCSACRAERTLRGDFAAELAGAGDGDALAVRAALEAARTKPAAKPVPTTGEVSSRAPARRRRGVVLLVAAAALAATAAGATELRARFFPAHAGTELRASESAADEPTLPASPVVAVKASIPSVVDPADVPASSAEAAATSRPHAAAPPAASARAAEPGAGELFASANEARRSGDLGHALALYDVLVARHPASREARASLATTGRLLLDRGDARGALARFEAYLASGASELREEAMAGRARAIELLGRPAEEARAWSSLLAAYPSTPYADHARARLAKLGE